MSPGGGDHLRAIGQSVNQICQSYQSVSHVSLSYQSDISVNQLVIISVTISTLTTCSIGFPVTSKESNSAGQWLWTKSLYSELPKAAKGSQTQHPTSAGQVLKTVGKSVAHQSVIYPNSTYNFPVELFVICRRFSCFSWSWTQKEPARDNSWSSLW